MPPEENQAPAGEFWPRVVRGFAWAVLMVRVYLHTSAKRGTGSAALPNV